MLTNYIKIALKVLARRKFFTFISLFGISLTLVVLMVVTAVLDNSFAPRPPESRFDRALVIYRFGLYGPQGGYTGGPGFAFLDKYARNLAGSQNTTFFTGSQRTVLYHEGRKIDTRMRFTDGAYWQVLDFRFLEGGPFTAADDANANRVAVISAKMREQMFGGAPAVGKTFELEGQRFRVAGVVQDVSVVRNAGFSDIWLPNHVQKTSAWKTQQLGSYNAVVLARSAADFPTIRRDFQQRLTHYQFEDPKAFNSVVADLDTPFEAFAHAMGRGPNRTSTAVVRAAIALAALLFMIVPTLNLVSINLSRILERASEIGVRKAFGASSRALIGQFVLENVILTLLGGVIGFALSLLALHGIERAQLVPNAVFDVNTRVFLYGMLLAATFGIVSGVYPAWRMSRMQPVNALRGGAL